MPTCLGCTREVSEARGETLCPRCPGGRRLAVCRRGRNDHANGYGR